MIDVEAIRDEMRRRIVREAGIVALADLQRENILFDPGKKKLWIRESFIEGEETILSQCSTRMLAVAQYEIHVPAGKGSGAASGAAAAIEAEFDPLTAGSRIVCREPELDVTLYRSSRGTSRQDDAWYVLPLLLYLRINRFRKGVES